MSNPQTVTDREKPILFSGEMVRALLDGRKTQTRRICKDMNKWVDQTCREVRYIDGVPFAFMKGASAPEYKLRCPYGKPGDRLWVKETHKRHDTFAHIHRPDLDVPEDHFAAEVTYHADGSTREVFVHLEQWRCSLETRVKNWKPSIHMPRWASRITLEITDVRVERIQDISAEDAIAEGLTEATKDGRLTKWGVEGAMDWYQWRISPIDAFAFLWDTLNSKRGYGWETNCWVWAVSFKRVEVPA